MRYWKEYHYKNLTILCISLLFALLLSRYEDFHSFLLHFGSFGYIGTFFAGMLFVSTFTVATGVVILLILAETLSPGEIAFFAGMGAVLGDLLIFRFIKDNLMDEITPIYHSMGGKHITALLHTKYFSWTLPVIGAVIIASPLPDEVGVSLMGIAKMKTYQFLLLSFMLNCLGIFLVIYTSLWVKP